MSNSPGPRDLHGLDGDGVHAPPGLLAVPALPHVPPVVLREVRLEPAALHIAVEPLPVVEEGDTVNIGQIYTILISN